MKSILLVCWLLTCMLAQDASTQEHHKEETGKVEEGHKRPRRNLVGVLNENNIFIRNKNQQKHNEKRRNSDYENNELLTNSLAGDGGRRCVKKVMMTEETVYDEVMTCDHSYDKRCLTSYITRYEPYQEEECGEQFRKSCFIKNEKIAVNEIVEVCRTPLVKDCNIDGDEVCQNVYESECWTKYEVHEVRYCDLIINHLYLS